MQNHKKAFRTALKRWRERENLTQARAASNLDCNLDTYRAWEAGRIAPVGETWDRIWSRIQPTNYGPKTT